MTVGNQQMVGQQQVAPRVGCDPVQNIVVLQITPQMSLGIQPQSAISLGYALCANALALLNGTLNQRQVMVPEGEMPPWSDKLRSIGPTADPT